MLKIAVVTRCFPSSAEPWQGRSAYQTLRALARECDLRLFYPNVQYPSWITPRTRLYIQLNPAYLPPEVNVSYFNYAALPMLSHPLNGWAPARKLLPYVRAFAPDLIFSIFWYPEGFAALKIGRAPSVPVVVMAIGSDLHSIGDRFSARHTRTVLRNADFLVAVSDDLRKRAVSMGAPPQNTRAIVNGSDLSVFHVADCLHDVAVWMTASDLVTLPSYMEGCPNVVLEALACGRPVVATRVGGIPEIMNDECGRLVPPRDSAELASALASTLDATWDPPPYRPTGAEAGPRSQQSCLKPSKSSCPIVRRPHLLNNLPLCVPEVRA